MDHLAGLFARLHPAKNVHIARYARIFAGHILAKIPDKMFHYFTADSYAAFSTAIMLVGHLNHI